MDMLKKKKDIDGQKTRKVPAFMFKKYYDQELMNQAVQKVQIKELSLSQAAAIYKVPKSTLYHRSLKRPEMDNNQYGKVFSFSKKEEDLLVHHLMTLGDNLLGMKLNELGRVIYDFFVTNAIAHPFSEEKRVRSKWIHNFLKRHPSFCEHLKKMFTGSVKSQKGSKTSDEKNKAEKNAVWLSNLKRGKAVGQWDTRNMMIAVSKVRSKELSLSEAANTYNVPYSSLYKQVKQNASSDPNSVTYPFKRPILGEKIETLLVEYLKTLGSKLFTMTSDDLGILIMQYLTEHNIPHPFSSASRTVEKKWLHNFLTRHPELREEHQINVISQPVLEGRPWEDILVEAVNNVKNNKLSLAQASEMYLISKSTIFRYLKVDDPRSIMKRGLLGAENEKLLLDMLMQQGGYLFSMPLNQVGKLMYDFIIANNLPNPFSAKRQKKINERWVSNFLKRHPEILQQPIEVPLKDDVGDGVDCDLEKRKRKRRKSSLPPNLAPWARELLRPVARGQWDVDAMNLAVQSVRNKELSFHKASELYNVPLASLYQRSKKDDTQAELLEFKRRGIDAKNDKLLAQYVASLELDLKEITIQELGLIMCKYIIENSIPHSFPIINGGAPRNTVENFIKRHPELKVHHLLPLNKLPLREADKQPHITGKKIPIKKRLIGHWSLSDMEEAAKKVQSKEMTLSLAAELFNVPPTTLYTHLKKGTEVDVSTIKKRIQISPEAEEEFVKHLEQLGDALHGLTAKIIGDMAYEFFTFHNIPHSWSSEQKTAKKHWVDNFFKKHPHVRPIPKTLPCPDDFPDNYP